MSKSYIMKVARPQPTCVSVYPSTKAKSTHRVIKAIRFGLLLPADEQEDDQKVVIWLSYSTFTCYNLFFLWLSTSPLCNLSDPLAALLRLTCRYAMATSSIIATERKSIVICESCSEEVWICPPSTVFGLKLQQVVQYKELV